MGVKSVLERAYLKFEIVTGSVFLHGWEKPIFLGGVATLAALVTYGTVGYVQSWLL
eukprot:EC788717.1.p3 GENE.EC788717.1~~EC788717.1.p3  ORF type:complete len:56 (+),score=11.07 EC788717.1:18-185(+)